MPFNSGPEPWYSFFAEIDKTLNEEVVFQLVAFLMQAR